MPPANDAVPHAAAELVMGFVAALRLPVRDATRHARGARTARGLLVRWAEPHRRYHTVGHLTATLDALRRLLARSEDGALGAGGEAAAPSLAESRRADLELAVWYHDAVYECRPGTDEEASAVLAEHELTALDLPEDRVQEVARLVRLTATHTPGESDAPGRLLCDADLSILGAPEQEYLAYTRAVREEYAHLPDHEYRVGRVAVLSRFAASGNVYATPAARRLWESRARANVTAELATLQ